MNERKTGKPGPVHKTPTDLRMALRSDATTQAAWKDLTPLSQNEWICWVISAKQKTTRNRRIQRAVEDLHAGKRLLLAWLSASSTKREEVVRETSALNGSQDYSLIRQPLTTEILGPADNSLNIL